MFASLSAERSVCYVHLSGSYFALENTHLSRIVPVAKLTPIPRSSETFLGLFSHEGSIFPLFDVRSLLGLGTADADVSRLAALVEYQDDLVGIGIEAVFDVTTLDAELLKRVPRSSSAKLRRYALGQTQYHDESALLLDVTLLVATLAERLNVV